MGRGFLLSAGIVFALALVAHGAGLGGGFVYDDHRFIELNPALARLDPFACFVDPASASASEGIQHDIYRPLRTLLFQIEWQLFGRWAFGWHLVSLLLHAAGAVLVLRLLWPLVRGHAITATCGAALFAVHPVAVECVAWVSSQGDLLAVVLGLLALLVLERPGVRRTLLGALLMALACFAKESALVFPALLLLRDLAMPAGSGVCRRTTWTRVAVLALVVVLYGLLRLSVIPDPAQVAGFPGGSRVAAARGMLAGLVWYARALVWPTGFPFDVHLSVPFRFADPEVVLGIGLLATLLAAGAYGLVKRRHRLLALATLGALACLVPVSNILIPLKAVVAERFLYPVLVCVAAGIAWALSWTIPRLSVTGRRALGAVGLLVMLSLVLVAWSRSRAWRDDPTLWETVLRERPSHARAYEGLAFAYLNEKPPKFKNAEIAYRSYLEYNPADGKAMRELGDLFGRIADALVITQPEPGLMDTNIRQKRNETRRAQLQMYERALRTWHRVGLVGGRGSERMRRETYEKVLEAALDLTDFPRVKRANDALIRVEGVDPADVDAVLKSASFPRRDVRLNLALNVAALPPPRELKGEAYRRRMAIRADMIRDVGIAPGLPDHEVLRRLLPMYRKLAEEPGAGLHVELKILALYDRLGMKTAFTKLLEQLRSRYPDSPILRMSTRPRKAAGPGR